MTTTAKIGFGIAAGLVALVVFMGHQAKKVGQVLKNLQYKVIDFGVPQFANAVLTVPLVVRIVNTSNTSLKIDSATIKASYLNANNTFTQAGSVTAAGFTILPGTTDKQFIATLDFKALSQNFLDNLWATLTARNFSVKTDVTLKVNGVDLPTQTLIENIRV